MSQLHGLNTGVVLLRFAVTRQYKHSVTGEPFGAVAVCEAKCHCITGVQKSFRSAKCFTG